MLIFACNSNKKLSNYSITDTISSEIILNDTSVIYPSLNGLIKPNQNSIYCSSFEIAWSKVKDEIIKEPIVLDKSIDWVENINKQEINSSIDDKYLVAYAGFKKDRVLEKIEKSLQSKFGKKFKKNIHMNSTDLMTYAYLQKDIKFNTPFVDEFNNGNLIFKEKDTVDFFGIYLGEETKDSKKQVVIHDYKSKDDFIIQIGTKTNIDEVYLAKIPPEKTLIDTYTKIINRVNGGTKEFIKDFDQLKIPFLKFNITDNHPEIKNVKILNENLRGYFISQAIQDIDFDLNEYGISVKSEGYSVIMLCDGIKASRLYEFNKPFMIVLKEKGKELPYFLFWVENSEFMTKIND